MFRLDFAAWLRSLTARERQIIRAMLRNERTQDLAQRFHLSQARISQLRREFHQDWERYCAGPDEQ
jgi:DNA-directed RNA polymerase specialized sigma subunit